MSVVNLFYQPLISEGIHHLDEEESRHCIKVLRKKAGDPIHLTDGKGFFYDAIVSNPDVHRCQFTIQKTTAADVPEYKIHIAIAPTKNADRIEWFVEKATEFGIDRITLMECENSERTFLKTERLRKIAVSAMKQSLKAILPAIDDLVPFERVISAAQEQGKFIAYVDVNNPLSLQTAASRGQASIVLIGPEGDFSPEEVERALSKGFIKVSLGKSRLRTETAAIAACHILNLVNA
ncbi:MAG TPA: 16S rRNA (uracil(1498)-N(3))-methyltransferase [Chryseosolibacter sp.]